MQPGCLINSRIGNGLGDYSIIEQKLSNSINNKPWEACLTMGKNWGYNRYDTVYKKPDILIRNFVDIVSKGGNLLLNVGPDQAGCFPEQTDIILKTFHKWLKSNGEAIYGTTPWRIFGEDFTVNRVEDTEQKPFHDAVYDGTPKDIVPDVRFTMRGKSVYIIVRHVTKASYTLRSFSSEKDKIRKVTLLENHKKVDWELDDDGLKISNIHRSTKDSFPVYVLKVEYF